MATDPSAWGRRPPGSGAHNGAMELLRTDRVLLRPWNEQDAPSHLAIYGLDEVTRWLGPHPRRPVADLRESVERIARWRERSSGLDQPLGLWAIVEFHDSPEPIGTVLLLPLGEPGGADDEIEIGWHLRPDRQGRGLVTEAAGALLRAAAGAGIAHVIALTDLDNAASQAVARRLGMTDRGVTDRWFGLTTRVYETTPGSHHPVGDPSDPRSSSSR